MTDVLKTLTQVAEQLNLSRQRVWQLIQGGTFPNAQQVGGIWLIPEEDITYYEKDRPKSFLEENMD